MVGTISADLNITLRAWLRQAISVRTSRPWQSLVGDRGRPPSATTRSARQPVSPAEGGVNLLSTCRGSQVLLERLSLATHVSQVIGQTPSMHCRFSLEDRDHLVPCQHHTYSSALALTAGDEQMTGQEHLSASSEPPPAEVSFMELERRAGILFSGATGAVVCSGGDSATTAATYGLVNDVIKVVEDLAKSPPELFDRSAEHRPCRLLDRYSVHGPNSPRAICARPSARFVVASAMACVEW